MTEEQRMQDYQAGKMSEEEKAKKIEKINKLHEKELIDISNIELRSEEVQEILGYIPHWVVRWGISVFFIVICVVLVGSWFFKYPDIITSSIVITTVNPPAAIVANTSGKIQHLFVEDKQEVKKGQYLAIIENSVNHKQLMEIKNKLDSMRSFFIHFQPRDLKEFNKEYSLGELQSAYAGFLKTYSDYRAFIELDYHNKKISSLNEQLKQQKLLYERQKLQVKILEDDFNLSKQYYQRIESLYKDGVISQNDFESAKSAYLQKQYSLEGAKSNLESAEIQMFQIEQSVLDLQLKYKEQKNQLQILLTQAVENLNGQILLWEQHYVLKTPIDGVVSFTLFWSINQNVKAGDQVITVVPQGESQLVGKLILPAQGSGKVKIGQKVNIKLLNYPYVDFGMVRGIIESKSLVAADNNYHLEVSLPYGLRTNYGKDLVFQQEMQGIAEIITEDIRMLERIFKPIKAILASGSEENFTRNRESEK